jgi:hypothetical protein
MENIATRKRGASKDTTSQEENPKKKTRQTRKKTNKENEPEKESDQPTIETETKEVTKGKKGRGGKTTKGKTTRSTKSTKSKGGTKKTEEEKDKTDETVVEQEKKVDEEKGKEEKNEEVEKKTEKQTDSEQKKQETNTEKNEEKKEIDAEILERGSIYFFYRVKLNTDKPHSLNDVQRLFMVLSPHESDKLKRLIVIGRKMLPDIDTHKKHWGVIDNVATDMEELLKTLGETDYETPVTHEKRHLKDARLIAMGMYGIVRHTTHSHLAYFLELPEELGEVQKAFHLQSQGSFILKIKNPKLIEGGSVDISGVKDLVENFGERRWGDVDKDAKLLDVKKLEFILVGASSDPVTELGTAGEEMEEFEKEEVQHLHPEHKVFDQLKIDKEVHKIDPFLTNKWV